MSQYYPAAFANKNSNNPQELSDSDDNDHSLALPSAKPKFLNQAIKPKVTFIDSQDPYSMISSHTTSVLCPES